MEALSGVLLELAILVAMALATFIATELRKFIKSKASKENLELLERIADIAVWAVEQNPHPVFGSKKTEALKIIEAQLRELKLLGKYPGSTIDSAIEAAVATNFHYGKHTSEASSGE